MQWDKLLIIVLLVAIAVMLHKLVTRNSTLKTTASKTPLGVATEATTAQEALLLAYPNCRTI